MTKILIIDDDPEMRAIYSEFLREDYPQILQAGNGKIGIELMENHKVDLVITDMLMPEQDGLNTILEIRHNYPNVKIIAISGKEDALTRAKFFGADRILSKPIDPRKLSQSITDLGF